jgi:hypothetical protein
MSKANPQVQCNVNECKYNEGAMMCKADQIQVTKHHGEARSTEATDCSTFELGNGNNK